MSIFTVDPERAANFLRYMGLVQEKTDELIGWWNGQTKAKPDYKEDLAEYMSNIVKLIPDSVTLKMKMGKLMSNAEKLGNMFAKAPAGLLSLGQKSSEGLTIAQYKTAENELINAAKAELAEAQKGETLIKPTPVAPSSKPPALTAQARFVPKEKSNKVLWIAGLSLGGLIAYSLFRKK